MAEIAVGVLYLMKLKNLCSINTKKQLEGLLTLATDKITLKTGLSY